LSDNATAPAPAPRLFSRGFLPLVVLQGLGAAIWSGFRLPLTAFCDLATCSEEGLITYGGDYASIIRIDGMRKLATRAEIEDRARDICTRLGSSFEQPGHAAQFVYISDPHGAKDTVAHWIEDRKRLARGLNANFDDIFAERLKILPQYMRQERIWLVLWTRPGRLSRGERRAHTKDKQKATGALPPFGDAQNPLLHDPALATIHHAFVRNVAQLFADRDVQTEVLDSKTALRIIRQEIYPETIGSDWDPITPADPPPDTLPDEDRPRNAEASLWPSLREQIFCGDAETDGFSAARLDTQLWLPLDVRSIGQVRPPIVELIANRGARSQPWRFSTLIEGAPSTLMLWKKTLAGMLRFGANKTVFNAFEQIDAMRERRTDAIVKTRMSFATSAPDGEMELLRRRASSLGQAIGTWGGMSATTLCGDPLAGTLSSVPGLAIASTAPPTAAPLSQIMTMMPWARAGMPSSEGAALFRTGDGTIVPYDPSGRDRKAQLDLFIGRSRTGKSALMNLLLLATITSEAIMTSDGYRVPLIGKLDIGDSCSGFVDMVQSALPADQAHLAVYISLRFIDEHAINIFDTEPCCRRPLDYHRMFLTNFLNLVCAKPDGSAYDGMSQLLHDAIDAAYALRGDIGPSTKPRSYQPREEPVVARKIAALEIELPANPTWWDAADALGRAGDLHGASLATRRAVPTMTDVIDVLSRSGSIIEDFRMVTPGTGSETIIETCRRYLTSFIKQYPTLCQPTRIDLGAARIVALDIDAIAPEGSTPEARRQNELMYLLGFNIVSRQLFLVPEHADQVPEHVREALREKFREISESFKRLECDEFQRTQGAPYVRAQFEDAARRGAKRNFTIGLASQRLLDFGDYLCNHSTGRFIVSTDGPEEAALCREKFALTDQGNALLQTLTGPRDDGSGSPFLLQIKIRDQIYEMYLVNLMGPVELWALSTTKIDSSLRRRVYDALGSTTARQRLARVFPHGSAEKEVGRRQAARMKSGLSAETVRSGVIDEIALEIINGVGLGAVIRDNTHSHRDEAHYVS